MRAPGALLSHFVVIVPDDPAGLERAVNPLVRRPHVVEPMCRVAREIELAVAIRAGERGAADRRGDLVAIADERDRPGESGIAGGGAAEVTAPGASSEVGPRRTHGGKVG